MKTLTFNDIHFVEVSSNVYFAHRAKWPKLSSYILNDDYSIAYWSDETGKVCASTSELNEKLFYIRIEMYQPLIDTRPVEGPKYTLGAILSILEEGKFGYSLEVDNDIMRIFSGAVCIARGPINDLMNFNPDYDLEQVKLKEKAQKLKQYLGNDYLESDGTIYYASGDRKIAIY